jgi:hypothetical protein
MILGRRENQGEATVAGNSLLKPEFNDFLLAPIGEERNEMPLSVLSALARLDVDPWQEAARLDQLPKELAAESLAEMIGDLPGGQWGPPDSRLIAARLVQLLPSRDASRTPSALAGADALEIIRSWTLAWLVYAALWGTLFMAGH